MLFIYLLKKLFVLFEDNITTEVALNSDIVKKLQAIKENISKTFILISNELNIASNQIESNINRRGGNKKKIQF